MNLRPWSLIAAVAALSASPAVAQPAAAPQPPDIAKAMLDAAAETLDAAQVAAVIHAASQVFPDEADAIEAYGDMLRARLSPLAGAGPIEVVISEDDPDKVEKKATPPRTADKELQSAPAPRFLDLGDWTGSVSASGLVATGNSENAAAGILAEAQLPRGDFTHNLRSYFDYGRSQGVKNQQRWGASYKLDYSINERSFAFARFSYDEDEFSGFDYRLFAGAGYGRWLVQNEDVALKVEGGPGYQYAPIDDTNEIDREFAFYGATEFDWVIRTGLKFEQDFNATWTSETSTLISTSTISTAFTDSLSTGLSYMYRYETNPPAGRVNEDTTVRANLTYGF
ncbi:MAG: DUF481 domain-containing protein [Pseudomonadota bacterium]